MSVYFSEICTEPLKSTLLNALLIKYRVTINNIYDKHLNRSKSHNILIIN